jgi:hypothetical protein
MSFEAWHRIDLEQSKQQPATNFFQKRLEERKRVLHGSIATTTLMCYKRQVSLI